MNNILQNYKAKIIHIKNKEPSIINSYVSQIYVINLAEDALKRNYIITLLQKFKINFSLVVVDRLSEKDYKLVKSESNISIAEAGCLLSHLWCLCNMISNSFLNAIIFEDDIILHKNFETLLLAHIERKPDFLPLGACDFNFRNKNCHAVSNYVYFPITFEYVFGAHANYYSLEGAKRMFEIKTTSISFFDNFYAEIFCYFPHSSGICYPPLALADVSSSQLKHSYGLLSIEETSYFYKCFLNLNFRDYHIIYIHVLKSVLREKDLDRFHDDYKKLCLYVMLLYFHNDFSKAKQVLDRMDFHFFNLEDVRAILS